MISIEQGKYSIKFDEKEHKYFVNNIEVPSVTTVMKNGGLDIYGHIDQEILKKASQRGTDVHKITELHDAGTIDIKKVNPIYMPFLNNWVTFEKSNNIEILSSELILYSPKYNFIGTIDRVAEISVDTKEIPKGVYILDIKTGALKAIARVQLAAYKMLYEEVFGVTGTKRIVCHLTKDFAKHEVYNDEIDKYMFLSCLQLYNFRKTHGLLGKK